MSIGCNCHFASHILVTGANRGIGLELIRQLVNLNPLPKTVIATCRDPDNAVELKKLSSQNDNISIIPCDVSSEASVESCFEAVQDLCPDGINLIINNAGIFPNKENPDSVTPDVMTNCLRTNVVAPFFFSKKFHPLLVKAAQIVEGPLSTKRAGIVMMSSNLGSITNTQIFRSTAYTMYNSSKAGLNMVMKCLALEYEKDGILVASIHPGWVQTDMGSMQAPLTVEESVKHMIATIPKMETGNFYNYDYSESGIKLPW